MSEKQADDIIRLLSDIKKEQGFSHAPDINLASTDFVLGSPFQLYVGVTGTVVGITNEGDVISRTFTAGYHPIWFKQITKTGTTATNLAALF